MSDIKEHIDVLVVGAGLAGIGFTYYLKKDCPDKSYEIIEARDAIGGTWDFFRYPGIRSDSDIHSYAYSFKPWHPKKGGNKVLAEGEDILQYIKEASQENGIDKNIRFNHRLIEAAWDSKKSLWTVGIEKTSANGGGKEIETKTCGWIQMCAGYYSYKAGYRPDFPNESEFQGEVIHPQEWKRDYDPSGKKFIVIGSGATAITLIPNLAKLADHVIMVQRSPSYIAAVPARDAIAKFLRAIMPRKWAYWLTRKKSIALERYIVMKALKQPEKIKNFILNMARKKLPEGFDVEKHFLPNYKPWEQRMCMSPDGDLFQSIKDGTASVATGEIESFTKTGLRLKSGETIDGDVIITATGLNLTMAGEAKISVDEQEIDFSNVWAYKGAMFSGVPNFSMSFGTLVATYTLRIELIANYVCRLLNFMDKNKKHKAVPQLPMSSNEMPKSSILSSFSSGYVRRGEAIMPKQGTEDPWLAHQTYKENKKILTDSVNDGILSVSA